MKNTLKFILVSFCALAFIGCEPAEPELDSNLNKDLTFTLELDEVDATSAKIKVSHNGTKEDTWFGFATTEANPLDAVEDLVAEVLANTSKVSLKKSTQTTYSVKELTPETEYTFVVVGLTAEGVVYGFPNSIEFKTTRDLSKLVKDDKRWNFSYERIVYEGEKVEAFTIVCAEDDLYYFTQVKESYIQDPNTGDIFIDEYADYVANGEIPEYVAGGYTGENLYCVGPGQYAIPRLESGKYYFYIVGMTKENCHDGSYAVFEFEVKEEEATPEYNQWLGQYEMVAANGVSYVLDIQHYDNNFMYAVTGWECGEELDADTNGDGKPDGMDFGTAFGEWIPAFPLYFQEDGSLLFVEYIMTQMPVNTQDNLCYLGFYGATEETTEDGVRYSLIFTGAETPLALATTQDAGATAIVESTELKSGDTSVYCDVLGYAAVKLDGKEVYTWNDPAQLPFQLTKVVEEETPAIQALSCDRLVCSQPVRNIAAVNTMKADLAKKASKTIKMYKRL